MKILIFGVGGVGGFLGSYLLRTNNEIFFLSRGKTYKKLNKNGLILKSNLEEIKFKKIKIFEKLPEKLVFDVVILSVKLYDLESSIRYLREFINKETIVLPFQNGIFSEEIISKRISLRDYYGAVAQISASINNNKEIIHHGRLATFFVGPIKKNSHSKILSNFTKDCQNIGLDIRFTKNIVSKIWEKFIFLSAYSGLTTMTKLSIGEIFDNERHKKDFISAMKETFELSKYYKVDFSEDPVEKWLEKIKKMPYTMTSSMFMDYERNKKLELNWLSGFVVRAGKRYKLSSKTHEKIIKNIISK
tara:strand:- start:254 stop:1162 length:909 start_codon:yes stop_codon:yes gene_type:complete